MGRRRRIAFTRPGADYVAPGKNKITMNLLKISPGARAPNYDIVA
jgi:hypothetical protein